MTLRHAKHILFLYFWILRVKIWSQELAFLFLLGYVNLLQYIIGILYNLFCKKSHVNSKRVFISVLILYNSNAVSQFNRHFFYISINTDFIILTFMSLEQVPLSIIGQNIHQVYNYLTVQIKSICVRPMSFTKGWSLDLFRSFNLNQF